MKDGIFNNQAKYTRDFIKFEIEGKSSVKIPMNTLMKLDLDQERKGVDQTMYREIIRSLLYLTVSRPDITFVIGVCARFQANPIESHLQATKKIFRYLKGTQDISMWYAKE